MPSKYEEEDISRIKSISINERLSKVKVGEFADPAPVFSGDGRLVFRDAGKILPDILGGRSLKAVAAALRKARDQRKRILWLLGAHVIKCGLSLYIRSLMENGYISALATTGSAVIHDLELAFFGETSEDVDAELASGRFGMSRETAEHFAKLAKLAEKERTGLGEGVGLYMSKTVPSYESYSIFSKAFQSSVPASVHVAFGTDIVHQHPSFPAGTVGELTMKDFRIFTKTVGEMFDGGMVLIFGSAVVLPEVFLKAVSINYNLGRKPVGVTAASFDMQHQYRVRENILTRPFKKNAEIYAFTGQHEIMLPLLCLLLNS